MSEVPKWTPPSVEEITPGAPPEAIDVSVKTEDLGGLPPIDAANTMNAREVAFGTSNSSVPTEKLSGVPPQNAETTFSADHFRNANDKVPESHSALQNGKTLAETAADRETFLALEEIREKIDTLDTTPPGDAQDNIIEFPKTPNEKIAAGLTSIIEKGGSFSLLINQGVEGMRQLGIILQTPESTQKATAALEKYLQKNKITPETILAGKGNEQVSRDIADTISSYIELAAQSPELAQVA